MALKSACDDQADWLIANLTGQTVNLLIGPLVHVRVMDVVAWQAYGSGRVASPWRDITATQNGILQLDAFAIASAPFKINLYL